MTTLTSSSSTSSSSLSTTSKLTTLSVANNTNVTSSSLVSGPGYAHRTTTTISPNEENKNSALQPTISKLNPNAQEFQPVRNFTSDPPPSLMCLCFDSLPSPLLPSPLSMLYHLLRHLLCVVLCIHGMCWWLYV